MTDGAVCLAAIFWNLCCQGNRAQTFSQHFFCFSLEEYSLLKKSERERAKRLATLTVQLVARVADQSAQVRYYEHHQSVGVYATRKVTRLSSLSRPGLNATFETDQSNSTDCSNAVRSSRSFSPGTMKTWQSGTRKDKSQGEQEDGLESPAGIL